jgi:predicted metal-dependent hydrolase
MKLSEETLRCLARGRALYEGGHHWDAHEAWEEAWQVEEGQPRLLLQGLIQVAAAMHKAFVQRQPASCARLLASALQKLDGLPDEPGGFQLEAFRAAARRALAHAERWTRGEAPAFDPAETPRLLVLDENVRPPG